jgi:acyl-CoA reductase-like NAD-dependent aldehyde dehydrogenase
MSESTAVDGRTARAVVRFEHWIDGRAHVPATRDYLDSHSPADGARVAEIARGAPADVELGAAVALSSQPAWASRPPVERSRLM